MKYAEREQLKHLFTLTFYNRYDKGEVYMKTYDALMMSYKIIDEFYKREANNEEKRSF